MQAFNILLMERSTSITIYKNEYKKKKKKITRKRLKRKRTESCRCRTKYAVY